MSANNSAENDYAETRQLARLAYVYCRAASRPLENGAVPNVPLNQMIAMMWADNRMDLVRLWAQVNAVLPQERQCTLNLAIIDALPRESLSIAEIFVGTLRRNVADNTLRKVVPAMVPKKTSGQFLAHAAPNLANVFDK